MNDEQPQGGKTTVAPFASGDFEVEQTLSLMDIYLTELCHRDELFWKQIFKYFYATLVVIFLPCLVGYLKLELPPFPSFVFAVIGLFMSIAFLFVSLGYVKRLAAIGKTYQALIDRLPKEPVDLRRISIKENDRFDGELKSEAFNCQMTHFMSWLMFCSLSVISLIMLFYYL